MNQTAENFKPKLILSKEQKAAVQLLDYDVPKYRLIQGYAGTGKTTVITQFLKGVVRTENYILAAPTNKAVKVLRDKLKEANCWHVQTCTIHSFLGLKVKRHFEGQILSRDPNRVHPYMDAPGRTLILDECSMLDEALMEYIKELADDWEYKIVFVGDDKQLPPIGELHSLAFEVKDKIIMNEIVRQAKDNPIINLSMQIRDMIDAQTYYKLKPNIDDDDRLYKITKGSAEEMHHMTNLFQSDDYTNDPDHVRFLGWTNKRVDELNTTIRSFLNRSYKDGLPDFITGERIVTTAPIIYDNEIYAMTDQEFIIKKIEEEKWEDIPVWRLHLHGGKKKLVAQIVQGHARREWEEITQSLVDDAKNRSIQWRDYYNWVESFHKVKHCHALTVHRSQGSTFNTVMVDVGNIMKNRKKVEALRCLYVACTRPSERLILVTP